MPRYESGKVYGTRSRSGRKGGGAGPSASARRRVKAGRPLGDRRSQESRPRSRRKKSSGSRAPGRWLRIALIAAVIAAILALGGYSTIKTLLLSQLVGVVVARDGQVEDLIPGKAFIVRDESVLRSPVSGTITLALEEGARAAKDAEVASLSDVEEREQAQARVDQLTVDLAAFDNSNAAEKATLAEVMQETSSEAVVDAAALRRACLAGDFSGIDSVSAELSAAGRRRADAAERLQTIKDDRQAIQQALETARAALEQVIFPVLAPQAGVVSYSLDGLEETLTPESIGQYGSKQLVTMARSPSVTADQTRVEAGDPVAKIIGDMEAYVSVVVTNQEADRLALARNVTLRFPGFDGRRETQGALYHVGDREKNGYCVITYLATELLEGMVSARQAELSLVAHVYSGAVLPSKAVVHRGGQDGVFVLEGGVVCRFRPVEVVGGNGTDVVVDGLSDGTQVISTPWLVKEGTRIGLAAGSRALV